jgi:hypothetical protein
LNFYQQITAIPFRGGEIDNITSDFATLENVNVTEGGGTLTHFNIDDDLAVKQLIRTRLLQNLVGR